MSGTNTIATETQKKSETRRQPEQEPVREGAPAIRQPGAPQAALQRARLHPALLRPADVVALQRVVGNRRAGRLIKPRITTSLVSNVQRDDNDGNDPPNPIASWIHPRDSILLVQTDDRFIIIPARDLVWIPDAASQEAFRRATPHLATDLGALMETPATGASGTRVFRAGRRAAMIIDAGSDPRARIPSAVYVNEFQGAMANLGVQNVSILQIIHVHQDHISEIPNIVANSRVNARQILIPSEYLGVNREIRRVIDALQGTTDPNLVARGFGNQWQPGSTFRDRGSQGDIFRMRYALGELRVEAVALRSALRSVRGNPDLASYLTKITRPADQASIMILGDLRGRDLASLRDAMEVQRAGSWNEFFNGVTTISGFSHHAGRMEDRDVAGIMSLLDATLLRQGRLRVVEQTSRNTHRQARSDTLELMQRLGLETAIAELPTAGGTSGAGATRDTLYSRGPAATTLGTLPSNLTGGLNRLLQLREARETIEIWRPWLIETGGARAEQFINELLPEINRSEEQLRSALRTTTETALRVRTGGNSTPNGGRDYSASGGARGQAYASALNGIPTTTPAETAITSNGFEHLRRLRALNVSEIPLRVAIHAAIVRGIYSDQAFRHMLAELEPLRRSELLSGRRGGPSPRHVQFRRVRAEFNFRRSVLGSGDVMRIPGSWSAPTQRAARGVTWLLVGLEVWNSIIQPLIEAQQASTRRFTGANLLPFLRRLAFWQQMGARPAIVGVEDPTFGSPTYERNYDTVVRRLRDESTWDALYFDEPGLSDLDVMRVGVWLSQNIRNYDEFSLLFMDSGQDAVTWEVPDTSSWEDAQWKIRVGYYETSGSNHVVERWYSHARLTELMNTYVRRIIANTRSLLAELGTHGMISEDSEARRGTLEVGGRPLYRSRLRQSAETSEVWVQPLGTIGAISPSIPRRQRHEIQWWTPPQFFVYANDSNGYTKVGGADYNTYALLRGLPNERHTPVIASGTIGADSVTQIGNEEGTVWIRSSLLTPQGEEIGSHGAAGQ